jgi:hypothetical protein
MRITVQVVWTPCLQRLRLLREKDLLVCRNRDSFSSSGACAESGLNGTFKCDGATDSSFRGR